MQSAPHLRSWYSNSSSFWNSTDWQLFRRWTSCWEFITVFNKCLPLDHFNQVERQPLERTLYVFPFRIDSDIQSRQRLVCCSKYEATIPESQYHTEMNQNYSNIYPTRCNVTQFILSGNCSTCFGWYLHPSSGAQTTVSTASGICQTVTATYR